MEEFECALCHKKYPQHPGGQAGIYRLCHRDHSEGETCYEQVTRRHTFGQDFSVVIEQLQQMRHGQVATTMRERIFKDLDMLLEEWENEIYNYMEENK